MGAKKQEFLVTEVQLCFHRRQNYSVLVINGLDTAAGVSVTPNTVFWRLPKSCIWKTVLFLGSRVRGSGTLASRTAIIPPGAQSACSFYICARPRCRLVFSLACDK